MLNSYDVIGNVKVDFPITVELVDEVLSCAFEGGINYWVTGMVGVEKFAEGATYASECVSRGKSVVIPFDKDDFANPPSNVLTVTKMVKGIQLYLNENPWSDLEDIDADIADRIVQYALFDEVIYG